MQVVPVVLTARSVSCGKYRRVVETWESGDTAKYHVTFLASAVREVLSAGSYESLGAELSPHSLWPLAYVSEGVIGLEAEMALFFRFISDFCCGTVVTSRANGVFPVVEFVCTWVLAWFLFCGFSTVLVVFRTFLLKWVRNYLRL